VLKGKLVVDAVLMTGVASVLQDEHGDVVKVSHTCAVQQLCPTCRYSSVLTSKPAVLISYSRYAM
jgi:hypothetical protein